jgi:drug/metabolite transporter (DMT)-like permease
MTTEAKTQPSGSRVLSLGTLITSLYVGIWVCNTMLIKRAQSTTGYNFDIFAAVLSTEATKFVLMFLYYSLYEGATPSVSNTIDTLKQHSSLGLKYAAPAAVYSIYNSLIYINLLAFDPGVYRVLINIRVVTSGILFQIFFNRQLGQQRWIALMILTAGCIVCRLDSFQLDSMWPLFVMLFQASLSSLGGILNEWLFKSSSIHFAVQNMYLYLFGVIMNLIAAFVMRGPEFVLSGRLFAGFDWNVAMIVLLASFGGVCTSFMLKLMSALHKEFANGIEMVITSVVSYFLFGTVLSPSLFIAIAAVWYAMYLYNNAPPQT